MRVPGFEPTSRLTLRWSSEDNQARAGSYIVSPWAMWNALGTLASVGANQDHHLTAEERCYFIWRYRVGASAHPAAPQKYYFEP